METRVNFVGLRSIVTFGIPGHYSFTQNQKKNQLGHPTTCLLPVLITYL